MSNYPMAKKSKLGVVKKRVAKPALSKNPMTRQEPAEIKGSN
jgi:hypothetical protein